MAAQGQLLTFLHECLDIRSDDVLLPAPLYTLLNQRVSTL